MSVPQWNADIITPDAPASDTPIATNGGLEKNQSGELGVSVDGSTVTINGDGQLEAAGGGGTEYSAGDGISIEGGTISAKLDGNTIGVNASGELVATVATTGVITGNGSTSSPVALNVGNGFTTRQSFSGSIDATTHVLSNSDSIGAAFENDDTITLVLEGVSGMPNYMASSITITDNNGFEAYNYIPPYGGSGTISLTMKKSGMAVNGTWQNGATILVNCTYYQYMQTHDVVFTSGTLSAPLDSPYLDVKNPVPDFDATTDNGKVLKIVNGAPAWVTP